MPQIPRSPAPGQTRRQGYWPVQAHILSNDLLAIRPPEPHSLLPLRELTLSLADIQHSKVLPAHELEVMDQRISVLVSRIHPRAHSLRGMKDNMAALFEWLCPPQNVTDRHATVTQDGSLHGGHQARFLSCFENTFPECALLSWWVLRLYNAEMSWQKNFTVDYTLVSDFIHFIGLSLDGELKTSKGNRSY